RPLTGPGVHERSAYQLIPEFRGARAQWNFTDHLATSTVSKRFQGSPSSTLYKADPPLAKLWVKSSGVGEVLFKEHIGHSLLWPSCGSSRAVLEKSSSRSTSDNIMIRDIRDHSCRASLRMWVFVICIVCIICISLVTVTSVSNCYYGINGIFTVTRHGVKGTYPQLIIVVIFLEI